MRNLSMVRMSSINRIVLTFTHIIRIRLSDDSICIALSLFFKLFLFRLPLSNEIIEPWVRACCIIWRVREVDDVIILSDRIAFHLLELRQLLAKLFTEPLTPLLIVLERMSKNGDWLVFIWIMIPQCPWLTFQQLFLCKQQWLMIFICILYVHDVWFRIL